MKAVYTISGPQNIASDSFLAADSWELKVLLALLTGLLGFVAAYALEKIRSKKSQKRLVWDATYERGLIEAKKDLQHDIEIKYKGEPVENLASVILRIRNSGSTVVKGQQLRVEFPRESQILDAYLDPEPPREWGAARAFDREVDRSEACFDIGHLERTQGVRIIVFTTGSQSTKMTLHPFNEAGDVDFQEGSTSRIREDRERLVPFTILLLLAILVPTSINSLGSNPIAGILAGIVQLTFLGLLIPTIPATVRYLSESLGRLGEPTVSGASAVFLGEVEIRGDLIAGGKSVGGMTEN
jgi:hypothetical protein